MKAESYVTSREVGIEYGYQLTTDEGDFIMDMVLGDDYCDDHPKVKQNLEDHRHLVLMMATAPKLLEALEDLHNACEFWEDQNDPVLTAARTAIAKAKGEKQ